LNPSPDTGTPEKRLKILLVDDDPADRTIFKHYLELGETGMHVFAEAGTGREGLSRVEDFKPDCILLDFDLPDCDGLTMIRDLRRGRDFLPFAVVMLTGIGSEKIAVEAMKLGVMDYLAKGPDSSQALSRTVASAVQRFRMQQEIARQGSALELRNRELEKTRAELFEEKERYRILAEAIPQLVWTADSDGRLQYANGRLWDFSGKASDRNWPLSSLVHPDDRAALQEKWAEAIRSGHPFESELRLRRAHDHVWRRHLMRTAPIRATEEGSVKWFGTFTDIEDQRRAEETLRQRQKLDSIGLLAGGVAHDFNNLLVGIMGGASFAMDSLGSDHPTYPMLEIVLRSSERAAYLTQQLLAYSGKGQTSLEPVDISRVAREVRELQRISIPKPVAMILETDDHLPLVETNASRMQQLVANLVMNAAEAIGEHEGVISVRTAVESVAEGGLDSNVLGYRLPAGRYVLIEVADSGIGMDEETQTRIFDPFFTTKFTGRGLGLAAVQGMVRTLGGGIQVHSVPGKGSTFRVLLPAAEAIGDEARDDSDFREGATVVLIVENEDTLDTAMTVLRKAGHRVITGFGAEGLGELDGRIDLVVLDAELSGRETLDRLSSSCARVPVVILTQNDEDTLPGRFGGIEVADVIRKPVTAMSLELSVNNILAAAALEHEAGGGGEAGGMDGTRA